MNKYFEKIFPAMPTKLHTDTSSIVSESLNFEDCIIESSKHSGAFSREWVEAEVKKSGDYFTKQIYSEI